MSDDNTLNFKPLDYGVVLYYLEELRKLKKNNLKLSFILLAGTLPELILKLMSNDFTLNFQKLLNRAWSSRKITDIQRDYMKKIWEFRISFIHKNPEDHKMTEILDMKNDVSITRSYSVKLQDFPYEKVKDNFGTVVHFEKYQLAELIVKLIKSFYVNPSEQEKQLLKEELEDLFDKRTFKWTD